MHELQVRYPGLGLFLSASGGLEVKGNICFSGEYRCREITGTYGVTMRIPDDYPDSPPTVYEPVGDVDRGFRHFMDDGSLCLGAPIEVRRRFSSKRTLLAFIDDLVVPYFFNYLWMREYGELPYGELSHGPRGLLEYYNEYFSTGTAQTLELVSCLAVRSARRFKRCPCGAPKKLKDCHGPSLKELRPHSSSQFFRADLEAIMGVASEDGVRFPRHRLLDGRPRKKRRRKRVRPRRRR